MSSLSLKHLIREELQSIFETKDKYPYYTLAEPGGKYSSKARPEFYFKKRPFGLNEYGEEINEAKPDSHFYDRVIGRLESSIYTNPQFSEEDLKIVKNQIELLTKVNFNPEESWAVMLNRYPTFYKSKDPEFPSEIDKVSQGTDLWILIRDNEIRTIMFRRAPQANKPIPDIKYKATFKRIKNLYDGMEKDDNGEVSISSKNVFNIPKKGEKKKPKLDLPIIELSGKKWFLDAENNRIIYAKNINKFVSFEKAYDTLPEEELDKLVNAIG